MSIVDFIDFPQHAEQACRIFHGRGHAYKGFEHVSIDWLPPVVLITLYREVDELWLTALAQDLSQKISSYTSIQVQYRCRKQTPFKTLMGESIMHTVVKENVLQFNIELGTAQNTGLFLDMYCGREWVRQQAKDKNILNLFAYTCAFSVAAIAGGASRVLNVDNNKSVLSRGRENHRLNQQDLKKVKFEGVDIFKSFSRIKKYGPYDLMICDPPTFQKGSVDIKRDYKKIIRRLPQFMKSRSQIMLCLNSPDLDEFFLHDLMRDECPNSKFIESIKTPVVFKESMPGKGLKILIFNLSH